MSAIYCTKCGLEGDSKCPFCRNVFADHDTRVGMIDTVMSYRLGIDEKGILLKRRKFRPDTGIDWEETDLQILSSVVDLLKELSKEELKTIVCKHEWDFKPFSKSEIGCGHGSEEKPLLDYMSDMWYYLTDGADNDPSKYPHPDDADVAAARIVNDALDAIEHGVEYVHILPPRIP